MNMYLRHNDAIRELFKDQPDRLLELDLEQGDAVQNSRKSLDTESHH